MKILHIGISEHLGGIETYLNKIAHNIDLTEYQFDFLTYHGVTPCFYEELCALGCRFQRVTPRREGIFKFRKEFDALLKREKYDIVHCHLNSLSFTEPINIALKNKCKVIVHSRNGEFIGNKVSKFLHQLHYYTLPRSKVTMLAVSDLAGQWMFGKNANFTVLNNGVDLKKFHFSAEGRNRIRDEFRLGGERVIVHTGAFRTQKNHEFIVEIFAALHQIESDAKLLLVGSGQLLETIEQKVKDIGIEKSVVFAGQRSDVVDILSAGDVYLFPSFYEGFPNALLEAEATGLYCIVANTITRQVEIKGQCQYLSLDDSAQVWAETIHGISQNNDRNRTISEIKEAGLDVGSDVERLISIYKDTK